MTTSSTDERPAPPAGSMDALDPAREPAQEPKRKRGRPKGVKNRPRAIVGEVVDDAEEIPSFEMPPKVIGAAIAMIFATLGEKSGEPEIWRLPPDQEKQLDVLGVAVANRYMPDFLKRHGELVAFSVVLGACIGQRVIATREAQEAKAAAKANRT